MKKEGSGSVGTQAVEERHRRSGVVLVRFVKGTLLKQEAEVTGGVNNVRRGGERRRSGLLGNPALLLQLIPIRLVSDLAAVEMRIPAARGRVDAAFPPLKLGRRHFTGIPLLALATVARRASAIAVHRRVEVVR